MVDIDTGFGPNVRNTDPDTSREAALSWINRSADRQWALHWHALFTAGLTDFELAHHMGRQQTSAGKRRGELRDIGLIEDSGQRRASPSGASAIVWRITPEGIWAQSELHRK